MRHWHCQKGDGMKLKKLVFAVLAGMSLWGCSTAKTETASSASSVSVTSSIQKEYPDLPEDNAFYEGDSDALANFLENGTGVVFFGNPVKENSQRYSVYLNDVLKENDLQTAVFDLKKIQENEDLSSQVSDLLKKESDNAIVFEKEEGPLVVFLNNGKVTAWDDETSGMDDVDSYWSEEKESALKTKLGNACAETKEAQKNAQNKGCEKACTFGGD